MALSRPKGSSSFRREVPIAKIENGGQAGVDTIERLAKELRLSLAWLAFGVGDREPLHQRSRLAIASAWKEHSRRTSTAVPALARWGDMPAWLPRGQREPPRRPHRDVAETTDGTDLLAFFPVGGANFLVNKLASWHASSASCTWHEGTRFHVKHIPCVGHLEDSPQGCQQGSDHR
jgi:hypothetical protein